MTKRETSYFLVPAPGHYGDRTRVVSSHVTLDAARKAARGCHYAIRRGSLVAGDEWLRVYEEVYPAVADERT